MSDIASGNFVRVAAAVMVLSFGAAILCRKPEAPAVVVPEAAVRIEAARLFTSRYAVSRLSRWNVRAAAAGPRCGVLLVETSIILEDSMVESMHYGSGPYAVYDGGVDHFFRERSFRGVAYRDSSGRIWTYGDVSPDEARRLAPCQ